MKTVYERLLEEYPKISKETWKLIESDWNKVHNKQATLSHKQTTVFKQKYPHLNDLVKFLEEKAYEK